MSKTINCDETVSSTTLKATQNCFQPLQHAETELRVSFHPTTRKVLPMLKDVKATLLMLSTGVTVVGNINSAVNCSRLAAATLLAVESKQYLDFWAAACALHPGLSSFFLAPL